MEDASDDQLIGIAEREAAIAALGRHAAAGRLSLAAFEQRSDAVVAARTRGDVQAQFADLPPLEPAGAGPGRLPESLRTDLTDEGLLLLAEDVFGTVRRRRLRRRERIRGTVAVSRRRLLIWAAGAKRADIPFDHAAWAAVEVSAPRPNQLRIAVDTVAFGARRPGRMVWTFHTDQADEVARLLTSRR